MRIMLMCILLCAGLGGCAPGYAGDPSPVNLHVNGRYTAFGGIITSH